MCTETRDFRTLGWIAMPDKSQVRDLAQVLKIVSKCPENPAKVARDADRFFFNEAGFRLIHSLDKTAAVIARLMEQTVYSDYTLHRSLYTIPTLEFIESIARLIHQIHPRQILEVGAGDGALLHYLKEASSLANLAAVDDLKYGGKFQDPNERTIKRPVYSIVETQDVNVALVSLNPDFVIASWYVSPDRNHGDDVKLLECPSVKHLLWIGTHYNKYRVSSDELWALPGWKKEKLEELRFLYFTRFDAEHIPHIAFPSGYSSKSLIRSLQTYQEGEVVLFSRE